MGDMISKRHFHTLVLVPDGKMLVIDGNNFFDTLAQSEWYDLITHSWTATDDVQISRMAHTALLLPSGKVLSVDA